MGEKCLPEELRTLFLFEGLNDEQLETLCQNGQVTAFEPGADLHRRRPGDLLLRSAGRRVGDVQTLRGRRHRDQPDLPARRLLRRVVGVRTR